MAKEKFSNKLSWEEFRALGNPDNVPEEDAASAEQDSIGFTDPIRIYLERKGRKGKTVTILKGIQGSDIFLKDLARDLKSSCGVGGAVVLEEIVLQGDVRKKTMDFLLKKGYKNVKTAGA